MGANQQESWGKKMLEMWGGWSCLIQVQHPGQHQMQQMWGTEAYKQSMPEISG